MTTKRATERAAAIALHNACAVLDLPCAYDARGSWLPTEERPEGYHAIDYASHYGGAYLYRISDGGGHHEPAGVLREAGFSAGGLGIKRWPLRKVIDTLNEVAAHSAVQRVESQRARYMKREISHDEYYGMLVELFGEARLRTLLPGNYTAQQWAALVEDDRHLNNVPLSMWDAMHPAVLRIPVDKPKLVAINGTGGWSLSDSGCMLKCAARRFAAEA